MLQYPAEFVEKIKAFFEGLVSPNAQQVLKDAREGGNLKHSLGRMHEENVNVATARRLIEDAMERLGIGDIDGAKEKLRLLAREAKASEKALDLYLGCPDRIWVDDPPIY